MMLPVAVVLGVSSSAVPALAQTDEVLTIGIIGGPVYSSGIHHLSEMSRVLQDKGLRVVPIAGRGPLQNLKDLIDIKGADAAVVQTDTFDDALTRDLLEDQVERFSYLTLLPPATVHLVVRNGTAGVADLAGKKISVGLADSGYEITARVLLAGEATGFVPVHLDTPVALDKLKAGEIDAVLSVDSYPSRILHSIVSQDDLKLLPLPFHTALDRHYRPTWLQHEDYRGLISPGRTIESVSVNTALIGYNWPVGSKGHDRLAALTKALAGKIAMLRRAPYHPAWKTVTFSARVPGWERHRAAAEAFGETGDIRLSNDKLHQLRASFKSILMRTQATAYGESQ